MACRSSHRRTRSAASPSTPHTLASVFDQIPGPVLAVGHSYGGAVITNAATGAKNVVGLVYVAAFAPAEGERLGEAESTSKDSVLNDALMPLQYPNAGGTATEFAINPAKFRAAFAADLPEAQTALMAATQRPVAEAAFSEQSGAPAWKNLPSWSVVATGDTGRRRRRHSFDGPARRRADHRNRGFARDHDLAAAGRRRRDLEGDRRRDVTIAARWPLTRYQGDMSHPHFARARDNLRLRAEPRQRDTVKPLELFFDLVFVLGFTQCTALMAAEGSWIGICCAAAWRSRCSGGRGRASRG